MILFRASASLAPGATDLASGWGLLASTEAHLIPDANHFSLLQMPSLDHLVEPLKSALVDVEGGLGTERGCTGSEPEPNRVWAESPAAERRNLRP